MRTPNAAAHLDSMNTDARTLPAGTYFLGDPCYAVPDERWETLLEQVDYFTDPGTIGTVDGHPVVAFAIGNDHAFTDATGHEYATDAGLIGLTPMALANPDTDGDRGRWLAESGRIVTLTSEFTAHRDGDTLVFGPYTVHPAPEADESGCATCGGEVVIGFCKSGCDDEDPDYGDGDAGA